MGYSDELLFFYQDQQPAHKILIELIEDLDKRREVMRKIEASKDINQASDDRKQEKIHLWADRLEKPLEQLHDGWRKLKKRG